MNTHYVCSECGLVSKIASTCQNDDCVREGLPLTACNCEDGKHEGIVMAHVSDDGEEQIVPHNDQVVDLDSDDATSL